MDNMTNKKWGFELLKGLIALAIAIFIFIKPAEALVAIATYLGVLAIIAGVVIIIMALSRKGQFWQLWVAEGFINAVIGLLIVLYPEITASLLILIIGFWITVFGIIQLIIYMGNRGNLPSGTLSLGSAILSLLVGLLLLFNPFEGAVLATLIMAGYAVVFAVSRFYIAYLLYSNRPA